MSESISGTNEEGKAKNGAKKAVKSRKLRAAEKKWDAAMAASLAAGEEWAALRPPKPPEPPKPYDEMCYDEQQALWKEGLQTLNEAWRDRLNRILDRIERTERVLCLANGSLKEASSDCHIEELAVLELAAHDLGDTWSDLMVLLGGKP